MAMPFTTPLSAHRPEPGVATSDNSHTSEHPDPMQERGLQEAPQHKRPHTLWEKIKHAFDFGSSGDTG